MLGVRLPPLTGGGRAAFTAQFQYSARLPRRHPGGRRQPGLTPIALKIISDFIAYDLIEHDR
jgi:hypothetical protein